MVLTRIMKLVIRYYEQKKGGATYRYARHIENYKGKKIVVSCPAPKGTPIKDLTVTLARALAERKSGVDLPYLGADPNMTINQLADLFMKDALDILKPKTIEEREGVIRNWILPALGSMKVRSVRSLHIVPMLDKARLNSPSTLEHVWKVVKRMFNFALENEYAITENPITEGLKKKIRGFLAVANATMEIKDVGLAIEDVACMFQEVKGKPYEIVFHWQLLCGLRLGEALGVKWEDMDFASDAINIRRQVSGASKSLVKETHWAEGTGPMVTTPKTQRGQREIPLQPQTKALLETTPIEERHGYIYHTAKGTPVEPKNYRDRVFNPIRKALGIPKLGTHDLRKFFGSFHIAQLGTDIITVSKWMGHANPQTTMKVYAKLIPELANQNKFQMGLAFGA